MKSSFTPYSSLHFDPQNKILKIRIYPDSFVGMKEALHLHELIKNLTGDAKPTIIIDATGNFYITSEAKHFLTERSTKCAVRTAIIFKNSLSTILTNIYLNFRNPFSTIRLFSSEKKAFEWLNKISGISSGSRFFRQYGST